MESIINLVNQIKNIQFTQIIDVLIAVAIVVIFFALSPIFSKVIIKIFRMRSKKSAKDTPFYKPLKIFFAILGMYIAAIVLGIPENIMVKLQKAFKIANILLIANGIANIFNEKSETLYKIKEKLNVQEDDMRLKFFYKLIRIVIYIIAGLFIIVEFNYNINGIIAGFGVGGVILTLAAQDTAKNLFGGIMLVIDKPFKVGDWIETKNYEGYVEDITFRSTRIRSFENSVVNIPNAVLSNESIVNWSRMQKRKYKTTIKLPLDTRVEVIESLIDKIEFMLENSESIIDEDTYVKFSEIGADGIEILIYVFTNSVDYASYMNAKQNINENILKILESADVRIAYPTMSVNLKNRN